MVSQLQIITYSAYIDENERFWYHVSKSGYVFKVSKKTKKVYNLKGYMKEGNLAVKVRSKEYLMKSLVAEKFMGYNPKNKDKSCIGLYDKNPRNCNVRNLYLYSYHDHGLATGWKSRSTPVVVEFKKDIKKYRSVREASKDLYCSYQTLLDYLAGRVKHSVLIKRGRRIYYEENTQP